jgi:hypothetical protein
MKYLPAFLLNWSKICLWFGLFVSLTVLEIKSQVSWNRTPYLLNPWSRALLEKLTGFAVNQEIPLIYGTPKFITVLTSARHLSLSWANSIQSPQPLPHFLKIHLNIILPLFYIILIILIIHNFSKHNIEVSWKWCRHTETCRSLCNISLYYICIYIYMCVCICCYNNKYTEL